MDICIKFIFEILIIRYNLCNVIHILKYQFLRFMDWLWDSDKAESHSECINTDRIQIGFLNFTIKTYNRK